MFIPNCILRKKFLALGLFFAFSAGNLSSLSLASNFKSDTFIYLEFSPLDAGLSKVKKFFFSLMNKKKAESEWSSLERAITEEFGVNLLSPKELKEIGIDINSPIGAAIYAIPVKRDHNVTVYENDTTVIFPATNAQTAYEFFLDSFRQSAEPRDPGSRGRGRLYSVIEYEKNKLFGVIKPKSKNLYFFKTKNSIVLSENIQLIPGRGPKPQKSLEDSKDFQQARAYFNKHGKSRDSFGFFFVNPHAFGLNSGFKQKLLMDTLLFENDFMKSVSDNSTFVSGLIEIARDELNVNMTYFFPDGYLKNEKNYLGKFLDFKNLPYLPDFANPDPFIYGKWQLAFTPPVSPLKKSSLPAPLVSNRQLQNILDKLTNQNAPPLPAGIEYLIKDNVSLSFEDIPPFVEFNRYYLWKGVLSFSYHPQYFNLLLNYMDSLEKSARDNPDLKVSKKKDGSNYLWTLDITTYEKKLDKDTHRFVRKERLSKIYIYANGKEIIFSHDEKLLRRKPSLFSPPVYKRLAPARDDQKLIILAYINMKRLLAYLKQSTLAFSVKGFLPYLENTKNITFKVMQEKNSISKELRLKLAK